MFGDEGKIRFEVDSESDYFCTKNSVISGALAALPGGSLRLRASFMVRSMLSC